MLMLEGHRPQPPRKEIDPKAPMPDWAASLIMVAIIGVWLLGWFMLGRDFAIAFACGVAMGRFARDIVAFLNKVT